MTTIVLFGWFGAQKTSVSVEGVAVRSGLLSSRLKHYHRVVNEILDMIAGHAGDAVLVIGGVFNLMISARFDTEVRRTSADDLTILWRVIDEFLL